MRKLLSFVLMFFGCFVVAQDEAPSFREDQIYLSIAYPYFSDPPSGLIQNKLSYAFSLGFVRDIPLNTKRTFAFGLGLGWDVATVFNNTRFSVLDNNISATSLETDYQKNTLTMQSLAIPFELRWRGATETKHNFWRIHSGVSLHIPLELTSRYRTATGVETNTSLPYNDTFLRWNLQFGFNTWNISFAQDMQPLAVSAKTNPPFDIRFTKIGLIFYIL